MLRWRNDLVNGDTNLKMSGDDSRLLVVSGSVAGQLKDLSSEVLHDSSQVDWSTSSNTSGIVSLAKKSKRENEIVRIG